eukprot:XP_762778.1 hypothetical protein [Theileria parva strain Muguga]
MFRGLVISSQLKLFKCSIKPVNSRLYHSKCTILNMSRKRDESSPYYGGISSDSTEKRKALLSLSIPTKRSHSNSIKVLSFQESQSQHSLTREPKLTESTPFVKSVVPENIKKMVRLFGKNPEFNALIYGDDNVLNCLTIKQRIMNFQVDWDIQMQDKLASCKYNLKTPDGKVRRFELIFGQVFTGETFSTNKKLAKKLAAREILSNLPIPSFDEMYENSRWMISVRKNLLGAREEIVEKTFTNVCVCKIEWKIGDVSYLGTGEGHDFKEAELYASQNLYLQTLNLKNSGKNLDRNLCKNLGKGIKSPVTDGNNLATASAKSTFDDELSRSDAAQINNLRNILISKIKIKKTVIKSGSSKLLARANASKTMLVEMGTIQDINPNQSQLSTKIKSSLNSDLGESVRLACELITSSNSTVWRLFILQLWNKLLFNTDKSAILKLLNTVIHAQNDPKQTSLQGDIWESMLYNLIYVMDEEFVRTVLNLMHSLKLNETHFYSKKALQYYQHNTILLCMEYQCNVCNEVLLRRENVNLFKGEMVLMDLAKLQMPNLIMTSKVDYEYTRNNIFKENDIVLLLPSDHTAADPNTPGLICNVLKHRVGNFVLNMTLKFVSLISNPLDGTQSNPLDTAQSNNLDSTRDKSRCLDEFGLLNYSKYVVMYVKSLIPYLRMIEATQSLTHTNAGKYSFTYEMKEILLNSKTFSTQPTPNSLLTNMTLTPVQYTACMSALRNPLTLIQGPPGTGKTHVACAIIDCWAKLNPTNRILAVADSNIAADNLIDALTRKGINALRIGQSSEYELQEDSIKRIFTLRQLNCIDLERYNSYVKLRQSGYYKEAKNLKVLLYSEAIKQHNIIIATCVGSGNDLLHNYQFSHVIIDECSQSIEMSNLIPIGKGCKSLVLIGDHKQLRPTIISNHALKLGLDKSLLERLIEEEVAPVHMLNVQRRMHPSIIEFPNMHFYSNKIHSQGNVNCVYNVGEVNRSRIRGFKWPVECYNVVFIDVSTSPSTQFELPQGKSKSNLIEVKCVMALLNSFLRANDVKEHQGLESGMIEVDSVDGFQGREKDLIIFTAVRSNLVKDIGFLKDPRRMNVMLTRARRGLVILGDSHTLMSDRENWRPYLNWIYSKGLNIHISQLNLYLDYPDHSLPKSPSDLHNLNHPNTSH